MMVVGGGHWWCFLRGGHGFWEMTMVLTKLAGQLWLGDYERCQGSENVDKNL